MLLYIGNTYLGYRSIRIPHHYQTEERGGEARVQQVGTIQPLSQRRWQCDGVVVWVG